MTDSLYALVPLHGSLILFAATFLSCLALPVPASLLMLAAGAFVASGDLSGPAVLGAAFAGAVLGDQAGFVLGRWGGAGLWDRLERRPSTARVLARARAGLTERAAATVFLSRWMFSPLGPWVNLAAGATGMRWRLFSVAGALGEAAWVGLYIGLGFVFAARVGDLGGTMVSVVGALTAGALAAFLGRMLWRMRRG